MGVYARDSATWIQFQGTDNYGDELTPVETPLPCRVEWKVRRVTTPAGQEVISAGSLKMHSRPKAGQDKIRIEGVDHLIVAVEEIKAFSRVHGYRAYIQ